MDEAEENFRTAVLEIERALNLRADFFADLLKGDDWSFVVKSHALVEAATTQLLATVAGDPRLSNVFQRLPLSNRQTGKLAFIRAQELLHQDDQTLYLRPVRAAK